MNKRLDQTDEIETNSGREGGAGHAVAMSEATRSAAESSSPAKTEEHKTDEQVSLFWRVFGGTLLSMVALGAITLYNSITTSIAELRNELNRERDARAELVKKDEFNTRASSQSDRIRSFEGLKIDFEGLKERTNSSTACFEALKKDVGGTTDVVKKDAAAIEVLKERVIALESVKKDVAGLDVLKEKLTAAASDLKLVRDDVMKIQQEQERNRASDLERKTTRDTQYKQVEESLKELQKGLQDCREKLARLEGMQPMGATRGAFIPFDTTPPGRTVSPADAKGGNPMGGMGKPNATGNEKPGTSKPGPDEGN